MPVQTAKKDGRQPVVINIPEGQPGAVVQHPIGGDDTLVQRVGKGDAGLLRWQQCETSVAIARHLEFRPFETLFLMPLQLRGARKRPHRPRQQEEYECQKKSHLIFEPSNRLEFCPTHRSNQALLFIQVPLTTNHDIRLFFRRLRMHMRKFEWFRKEQKDKFPCVPSMPFAGVNIIKNMLPVWTPLLQLWKRRGFNAQQA